MKETKPKARLQRMGRAVRHRAKLEDGGAKAPKQDVQAFSLPERQAMPRPTDAEIAERLRGTKGRLFVRQPDGQWHDTETGVTGTRAEVEQAWLAELA